MLILGDSDPNHFRCCQSVAFHHFCPPTTQIIRSRRLADPVEESEKAGREEGIDLGDSKRNIKARKGRKGKKD